MKKWNRLTSGWSSDRASSRASSRAVLARFLVSALAILPGVVVQADIIFFPGLGYTAQTEKLSGTKVIDTTMLNGDGRLGWVSMTSGLFIGGMYKYESGTGIDTKIAASSYGPSMGYVNGGLTLVGTYFLQGARDETESGVVTNYKKGSGYQVDLAYMAATSQNIYVGPQISYRSVKYTQATSLGVTADAQYQIASIQPTLAFLFKF